MLYLTRKVGESVIINENIEVTVVEVRGRSIKLGFTFPPHVSVLRREIFERIQAENRAAADPANAADLPESFGAGLTRQLGLGAGTAPPEAPSEAPTGDPRAREVEVVVKPRRRPPGE